MFGGRYTGEEEEVVSGSINWHSNFIGLLSDATASEKVIWRREGHGDEYSTAVISDAVTYVLRFGSVPNRARKPPVVHFLKIVFNLGDITILEPDQEKGFIRTEYADEIKAELAHLMQRLGSHITEQVKKNEAEIKKSAGNILQRISTALR